MGYVHEDIAGHDAIEISEAGGRMVRLPEYADTANLMRTAVNISLTDKGAAGIRFSQKVLNRQYENYIPLLKMDEKDRQKALQQIVQVAQAEIGKIDIREYGAMMTIDTEMNSQKYATTTGQRLFVPICPVHHGRSVPNASSERLEDLWFEMGYLDEDDITIAIPEGYEIEARPKDMQIEEEFGSFSFTMQTEGQEIRIKNRLLRKSGSFDKSLFPRLADFIRTINSIYNQKIVLKKSA
jgi:hypothetical protein